MEGNRVVEIRVLRGAPCGATWDAAPSACGLTADEAPTQLGLRTQVHCTADPSNWDPIRGKSPVHLAGEIHRKALKKALERALKS